MALPASKEPSGAPLGGTGSRGVNVGGGAPAARALVEATVVPMGPDGWEARAQGILWVGGRLRLVGSTGEVRAEARRLGIEPERLDGRMVLPGFVDAHTHFLHVGVKTTRPDLRGSKSLQEALSRTARWLAAHPGSGPVIAEGWDESEWGDARRPTRGDVDAVVAAAAKDGHGPLDRPVVLRRICGHVAVAGSGALPLVRARWDDDSAVDRGSGLLLEAPSLYLNEVLPSTPEQLDRAVQEACREAHRLGVTAVGDYSQAPYRAALQRAAARGALTVRVASSIYVQQ
ncbi:MAG TPA: amidohydrolase family protein, partial [Candidatus Thermoplasmatota archaeon]|nr:amidohydrolase family protein [Candidatus Thermoplasmatota archaeon]